MCGALIEAFTSETIKKVFPQLAINTEFFIMHLSILVRSKTEDAVGTVCTLLRNWPLGAYLPITVEDGAVTHRNGDRRIFSKKTPPLSLY
jgi:hypothetical protein